MKLYGMKEEPEWLKGKCPYCHQSLGGIEKLKRKMKKIYKCKKCNSVIDERYIKK